MSNSSPKKWGFLQPTIDAASSAIGNANLFLWAGAISIFIGFFFLANNDPVSGTLCFSITSVTWLLSLIFSVRSIYFVNLTQLHHNIYQTPVLGSLPPPQSSQPLDTWPIGWTQEMKDTYTIAQQNNPSQRTESPEEWAKKFYK